MNAGSEAVRYNGPPQSHRKAGRERRVAGWSLVTAGVIVAALWLASGWWAIGYCSTDVDLSASSGCLIIDFASDADGFHYWSFSKPSITWWLGWGWEVRDHLGHRGQTIGLYSHMSEWLRMGAGRVERHVIVLWPFPLLLWTTGGLALWSGRRARRRALTNHCPTCGYNLAGLNRDAPCPECGKAKAVS